MEKTTGSGYITEAWIRGNGYVPKCHGSETLVSKNLLFLPSLNHICVVVSEIIFMFEHIKITKN
jgi:hypothetical protein